MYISVLPTLSYCRVFYIDPEVGIVIGCLILVVLVVGVAIAIVVGIVKYKQHKERQKQ